MTEDKHIGWIRDDEWFVCLKCLDESEAVGKVFMSDMELEELCASCWEVMGD